jgi:hypothetical protein
MHGCSIVCPTFAFISYFAYAGSSPKEEYGEPNEVLLVEWVIGEGTFRQQNRSLQTGNQKLHVSLSHMFGATIRTKIYIC